MTKKEVKIQSTDEAIKQGGINYVVLEEGEKARKPRLIKNIDIKDLLEKCPQEKRPELLKALKEQGINIEGL